MTGLTTPRAMAALAAFLVLSSACAAHAQSQDWPFTEGAPGGGRYSPLADIDRSNVASLEVVWTYRHGDWKSGAWRPDRVNRGSAMESTPIVVDGRLIFTTPFNRVIALDPETGRELWTYDPRVDTGRFFANMIINRGVAYWRAPDESATPASAACARRVFLATLDARLIALDAASGEPCADFAGGGSVDLLAGLEPVLDAQEYNVTSPPTVLGDVVVVGSSIADTVRRQAPPGDVRAYDARSGRLRWTFHTIPHPGEPGAETWEGESGRDSGAANVWSTMTADPERGLLFLPVSAPSPDFFGGDRPGANLFGNSLVALRAATGERVWHYQTVHHDVWDYDLAAPPNLVQVQRDGRLIDAVAVATKHGFVFVLDRDTGEPLFPVEERPAPQGGVEGEKLWPTQPVPTRPPPLVSQRLSEDDLWDVDPGHLERCRERLRSLRNDGLFTPPSVEGSVLYPFTGGGANWSGAAYDPVRRRLYVPVQNRVHVIKLKRLPDSNFSDTDSRPMRSYLHAVPFLLRGRGTGLSYQLHPLGGRTVLRDGDRPCNRPPWGMLVAVDLDRGEIAWRASTSTGDGDPGSSGYGPALATAGGLVFHAGTRQPVLRVHDAETGERIATFELPAGLHAGPITYRAQPDARQLLVVAPGGHVGIGSALGDYVIAYALPDTLAR